MRLMLPKIFTTCVLTCWLAVTPARAQNDYVLGPDDQITVHALHIEEMPIAPIRIGADGYISLPLVGRVKAAGLTVALLEKQLASSLGAYVQSPDVSIGLTEQRSQPVSVMGAVGKPGIYQLQGRKTLSEVLSLAEGLRSDAGHEVVITRSEKVGLLPLPDAKVTPSGDFSVGSVEVRAIMQGKRPDENIEVLAHDIITVPKAELVYVMGDVRKPGGFVLNEHETISVLQALSLAEGLLTTAAAQHARVLRATSGSADRTELPLDVKKILEGRSPDFSLHADDILFIPNSIAKGAFLRGVEAAVQVGTGVVIWGKY